MKLKFTILPVLLFAVQCSFAQLCDIQTSGLSITPGSVSVGNTATFKFNVFNDAAGTSCTYAPGQVQVVLSLPAPGVYQFQSITNPPGGVGAFFTYTYDAFENVVIGTNTVPVGDGQGETDVSVQVLATGVGSAQAALNIEPTPTAVSYTDNQPGNNSGTAPLVVTGVLPLKLTAFAGASKACSNVLNFTTSDEKNVKTIEIEQSENSIQYKVIGSVQPKNGAGNNEYTFSTEANSAKEMYRLKITDVEGHIIYSNVITISTACKQPMASVFPNPLNALQTGTVLVQNFGTKIKGTLQDLSGKQLEVMNLLNGTNKLNMSKYAAGTYLLRIIDENNQVKTLKIITHR